MILNTFKELSRHLRLPGDNTSESPANVRGKTATEEEMASEVKKELPKYVAEGSGSPNEPYFFTLEITYEGEHEKYARQLAREQNRHISFFFRNTIKLCSPLGIIRDIELATKEQRLTRRKILLQDPQAKKAYEPI